MQLDSTGTHRRRIAVALSLGTLTAAALVGAATTATAATHHAAAYTWTGADAAMGVSSNWSDGGNWAGGTAPAANTTTSVAFPALACVSAGTCNQPYDDIDGLTLTSLSVVSPGSSDDSPKGYVLVGNAITLQGTFSISGDSSTGSNLPGVTFFQPMTLAGSSDTWSVSQVQLVPAGGTTGSSALKVALSGGGGVSFNNDTEVGKVTVAGAVKKTQSNGGIAVFGSLNATSGGKISVTDASMFIAGGQYGPLSTDDVGIQLGNGGDNHDHGATTVAGAMSFNAQGTTSVIAFENGTNGAAPQGGTDFPTLTASGAVKLAGELNPFVDCDAPIGVPYTFISGSKISGSFKDTNGDTIKNNATISAVANSCNGPAPQVKIIYSKTAVTLTVLSDGFSTNAARTAARSAHTTATPRVVRLTVGGRTVQTLAK